MKILITFTLVLLLAGCSDKTDQHAMLNLSGSNSEALESVVLLGDSIRINYQATVAEELKGKLVVWAPTDNCQDTTYMIKNLEYWLAGMNPTLIHINVGLHDMILDSESGKPRHTLETYEENLRTILTIIDKLTDAEIVFALTTVVNEERQAASETYGRVVRRNSDVKVYNAKALEIAKEFKIQVNDLYAFMDNNNVDNLLIKDGIHLSKEGSN